MTWLKAISPTAPAHPVTYPPHDASQVREKEEVLKDREVASAALYFPRAACRDAIDDRVLQAKVPYQQSTRTLRTHPNKTHDFSAYNASYVYHMHFTILYMYLYTSSSRDYLDIGPVGKGRCRCPRCQYQYKPSLREALPPR